MNKILTRQFILLTLALLVGGTVNAQSNIGVQVNGNVFGGGNEAAVQGHTKVEIKQVGAVIGEDVYGGGAKANVGSDATKKDTVILSKGTVTHDLYGGGLGDADHAALVNGPVEVFIKGGTVRNVFGCNNVNGAPQTTVNVTVNGGTVTKSVFGGGNVAPYSGSPVVTINGGTVTENVFGGGNLADVTGNTSVTVNGGTIVQDVYGGGALADVGTDANNTTIVEILGGTIQRAVYGGGLGNSDHAAKVMGVVTVNIGKQNPENANDTIGSATLIGASVYGGNNANGSPQDNVYVNVWKTAHTDTDKVSYLGADRTYAIANVFGGGNAADYVPATGKHSYLYIHGCYNTVQRSFGGGNAAATPDVQTIIDGGRFDQVFGGGNGEVTAANINGNVDLQIHGGNVGQFYGGSNTSGTITGTISTAVDNNGPCGALTINEFFCGGNFANITHDLTTDILCGVGSMNINNLYGGCNQADITGNVTLNIHGGNYYNVYGGSKGDLASLGQGHTTKAANISGNVTLNLYGGIIENAFGGSNVNGDIAGRILINVLDEESPTCPLYVTNIYGGSNMTSYEPTYDPTPDTERITPVVNVIHAKNGVAGNVYGGSKGVEGTTVNVNANPLVNIGYDEDSMSSYVPTGEDVPTVPPVSRSIIAGSVFGGGDAATVNGNTEINLRNRAKVFGNVYGGGNMGVVNGDTKVNVNGANH